MGNLAERHLGGNRRVISKVAILERAKEWQLTPDVVEKDYVLGWMLAGIARHSATAGNWIFKGGTCLKKCVIETYRFSEDLDFTLMPGAEYTAVGITAILREITTDVTEMSGIQFPATEIRVKTRQDRFGRPTFEASIGYIGPMAVPGPPKIRLDLTIHEPVLRPVERRAVFHPYPDALPEDLRVSTYAVAELVAEKTRALCERSRPRDLYDVVLLGPSLLTRDDAHALREVAREKFFAKQMSLPTIADVVRLTSSAEELRSEWGNMLGHQLPAIPLLDDFLARLPEAIAWLEEPPTSASQIEKQIAGGSTGVAPRRLRSVAGKPGEELVASRGIRTWGIGAPLEAIRFAGASHLVVEFLYHGATRLVEPYSIRRPKTGNLLLYGFEQRKNGASTNDIRSYKINELQNVRVLSQSFVPRYAIELSERAGVWRW